MGEEDVMKMYEDNDSEESFMERCKKQGLADLVEMVRPRPRPRYKGYEQAKR
jgi:hypothetical protein